MVKKLIAGALSGTLFLSAVMTEGLFSLPEIGQTRSVGSSETPQGKSSQLGITSTNSFGKLIEKASTEKNENAKNVVNLPQSSKNFEVTNLGFDAQSGALSVASTQDEACTIVFVFEEESSGKIIQTVKAGVKEGQSVITKAKADLSMLPVYYNVRAYLENKNGQILSNTYTLNTYTKVMQEIAVTNIHDFTEGQVVNFDESEDTNFIVLSDDTIIADSTEETNTLVSADYDNNVFVIDNIDDSIADLQSGEYFYMQPNDDDLIAVAVDNIQIEGSTATIKGNDEVDDMFNFIKVEAVADDSDILIDTSGSDDDLVFPEHQEDAETFSQPANAPLHFTSSMKRALNINYEASYTVDLNGKIGEDNKNIFDGKLTFKPKVNFCKRWEYTSFGISLTIELKASIKVSTPNLGPVFKRLSADPALGSASHKMEQDFEKSIAKISIPTNVPGVVVNITPKVVLQFSGSIELSVSYAPIIGAKYDSDNGWQNISQFGLDQVNANLVAKGEIFLGIKMSGGLDFVSDRLAHAALTATAGFRTTISLNVDDKGFLSWYCKQVSESKKVIVTESSASSIHSCDLCFDGQVCFELTFGIEATVIGCDLAKKIGSTISIPLDIADFYISFPNFPNEFDVGFRQYYTDDKSKKTCPFRKYRVDFNVAYSTGDPVKDAEVVIDGISNYTDESGHTYFYCDGDHDKYSFDVYVNGLKEYSNSFNVNRSTQSVNAILQLVFDKDGNAEIKGGQMSKSTGPMVTAAATTARVTHPVTTHVFVDKDDDIIIQPIQLGDNVWGFIYNDGYVHVCGNGDMYDFSSTPFKDISSIKTIVFEDVDGKPITSVGSNVFSGAKNLQTVYLSNSIKRIGSYAFYNCRSLAQLRYGGEKDTSTEFVLPSALTYIGNYAFYNCSSANLGSLTVPAGVTNIGASAFTNCNITELTIPKTKEPIYIGNDAFSECSNIQKATIYADLVDNNCGGIFFCTNPSLMTMTELVLPAFINNGDISRIFNNNDDNKLYNHTNIPSNLQIITILSGDTIPVQFFKGLPVETIALPTGIKSIGKNAFVGLEHLQNIVCSDKTQDLSFSELFKDVESIGPSAFSGCKKLNIGKLSLGSKFSELGSYAFNDCEKITDVKISGGTITAGKGAFCECTGLKTFELTSNTETLGVGMFFGCSILESIILPSFIKVNGLESEGIYELFRRVDNGVTSKSVVFPKKLNKITVLGGEKIPNEAFNGMNNIETFVLPGTLTSVGNSAFNGCTGFEKLYVLGSKIDWKKVTIGTNNQPLLNLINSEEYIATTTTTIAVTTTTTTTTNKTTTTTTASTTTTTKKATTTTTAATTTTTKKATTTTTTATTTTTKKPTTTTTAATTTTKKATTTTTAATTTTTTKPVTNTTTVSKPVSTTTTTEREVVQKVKLGDDITGTMYDDGSVYIAGEGDMYDNDACPFENPENIKKVVMQDPDPEEGHMITSIGSNLFNGAEKLEDAVLSGYIKNIGENAFAGAGRLRSIILPKSIETIGDSAFSGCTGLERAGYAGSKDDWSKVIVGANNEPLTSKLQFNITMHDPLEVKISGDSNGDGQLTKADGILLSRFIAGWDGIVIILTSGDINGDGQISKADGMILARFLAGWEGYDKYFS